MHTMTMEATVPAAKQASAIAPSSTPDPMATRMSRPAVPPVLAAWTLPVRGTLPLVRLERVARVLGSGAGGGDRRDAAAAAAAALMGTDARRPLSPVSNSGS